jgi:hypothetical protein
VSSDGTKVAFTFSNDAFVADNNGASRVGPWSPDGSQIAFNRGQSIWATDRDGAPGSERLLIEQGITPTWRLAPAAGESVEEPSSDG